MLVLSYFVGLYLDGYCYVLVFILWFSRYWWIGLGAGCGLLLFNSVGLDLIGLLVVLLRLLCVGLVYG